MDKKSLFCRISALLFGLASLAAILYSILSEHSGNNILAAGLAAIAAANILNYCAGRKIQK